MTLMYEFNMAISIYFKYLHLLQVSSMILNNLYQVLHNALPLVMAPSSQNILLI
jgi:hypothetical protein